MFIFEECHRSQFGKNHQLIKEFFTKSQLFGFTGTPIFIENSIFHQVDVNQGSFRTTQDIFEKELHSYTIADAIDDGNVLKFNIDYYGDDKLKKGRIFPPKSIIETILEKTQ